MSRITYLLKAGVITFPEYEIASRFKREAGRLLSSLKKVKRNDIDYVLAVR